MKRTLFFHPNFPTIAQNLKILTSRPDFGTKVFASDFRLVNQTKGEEVETHFKRAGHNK